MKDIVSQLIESRNTLNPIERPTLKDNISVKEAYEFQLKLVQKLLESKEKIAGFKVSPKTVSDSSNLEKQIPVFGHLFASSIIKSSNSTIISKSDFIDMHIENEVAFIIGEDIDASKISSPEDLKSYVKGLAPAIELPDIRYSGPIDDVTGIDLVVDNVVASKVILGKEEKSSEIDTDSIKVEMKLNGRLINEGSATFVEGSIWNSLFWLVKELDMYGIIIKKDHIIMPGGINKFMDGSKGNYEANYSGMASIRFDVK